MLAKLKDNLSGKRTDELAAEISSNSKATEENAAAIDSLRNEITAVAASIKLVAEQQKQLVKETGHALTSTAELKKELEDSINSVKLMSSSIQNNLVRKITDEVNSLMQEISGKFSGTERLKAEIENAAVQVNDELGSLKDSISKLQAVASQVKAQDFELVKFTNQLKQDDSEKLKLMREIDSLQRLVSSLRRRN